MNRTSVAKVVLYIFFAIAAYTQTIAIDRTHFYAASQLWEEPRFEKEWLMSIDFSIFGGSTCEGTANCCHSNYYNFSNYVCLLDIYGYHNMQQLGKNIQNLDQTKETDLILYQLQLIEPRNNFGKLSFSGKFYAIQSEIMLTQNFKRGFFAIVHLPIRSLEIKNLRYKDLSPTDTEMPNIDNPTWQTFLTLFDKILTQYSLDITEYKNLHTGDLSLLLGWTKNYEDTTYLDFIDFTAKIGLLAPTGKEKNPDKVFSLTSGYDGHWGVPILLDFSIGLYEWLTIATHIDAIYFFEKNKIVRMKTALEQSGFIKLAKGCANINPGTVFRTGFFIKADHFAEGLSFIFGYSYATKTDDCINPDNTTIFEPSIVNTDQMYKRWSMHSIHLKLEYDFTKENDRLGPRIGFFSNLHAKGKRTFKTSNLGGSLGFDIVLKF